MGFEAFECKFELNSKRSNANLNPTKRILSIWNQIRTIRKKFEAFECKFEQFERDSKHSNANSNHSKGIWSIQMQILTIRRGFEEFESKFKPLNQSVRMKIRIIRKEFKAFEYKFEPFERDSKHSIENSNHSKGISSIRMPWWQLDHLVEKSASYFPNSSW